MQNILNLALEVIFTLFWAITIADFVGGLPKLYKKAPNFIFESDSSLAIRAGYTIPMTHSERQDFIMNSSIGKKLLTITEEPLGLGQSNSSLSNNFKCCLLTSKKGNKLSGSARTARIEKLQALGVLV